mgnify:CR=1 FL=1
MTIKEIASKGRRLHSPPFPMLSTIRAMSARNWWIKSKLLLKKVDILKKSKKVRKIRKRTQFTDCRCLSKYQERALLHLCNQLQSYATSQGYQFYTAVTNDSPEEEKSILQNLISSAKTIGIFLSPVSSNPAAYSFLYESGIPFVCVERFIDDDVTPRILFDYTKHFTPLLPIF